MPYSLIHSASMPFRRSWRSVWWLVAGVAIVLLGVGFIALGLALVATYPSNTITILAGVSVVAEGVYVIWNREDW